MREVREITAAEMDDFVNLSVNAYPGAGLQTEESQVRFRQRMLEAADEGEMRLLALFEDGEMRGVMRWYDFTMNLLGTETLAGGIGGVAVDLPFKKQGVAADMLRAFLQHYNAASAPLATLYPFRPDFYRRMGFGYGAPLYTYRFRPVALPEPGRKGSVVFLDQADEDALAGCYGRYQTSTHGMMARSSFVWQTRLADRSNYFAGLPGADGLEGYVIFRFEPGAGGHFLSNQMFVRELVYNSPEALQALLGFLRIQADQIETIIYNSSNPLFFHALDDPRVPEATLLPHVVYHTSSTQGVGLMYRVLDMERFFAVLGNRDFGGQTVTVQIDLADSFFPQKAGSTIVVFERGRAKVNKTAVPDVILSLDVADFSSLALGCADARLLHDLGLLRLSDRRYLEQVRRLFATPLPECLTSF